MQLFSLQASASAESDSATAAKEVKKKSAHRCEIFEGRRNLDERPKTRIVVAESRGGGKREKGLEIDRSPKGSEDGMKEDYIPFGK